tara:strand:+ start:132 stop:806 length:675 start_codon:yes stop_codon:yes gene_type:complete
MEIKVIMSQLTFKFPFKTTYKKKDFYVSSNNFNTYKLLESWPSWPSKKINIHGQSGCGKTHLASILVEKINSLYVKSLDVNENTIKSLNLKQCLIIDNYESNINEELLYSILNQIDQDNQYVVINSLIPIKEMKTKLADLNSRLSNFVDFGIDLPTDELIRVILIKSFSDRQIEVNMKLLDYILNNIERSYEKIFKFIKDIDIASLTVGKPININLIKQVLKNE